MDAKIAEEILNDLIPSLEALETKSAAVLEFLTNEGVASDEKLAPYLEQAASASSVRWTAARVRIERLLTSVEKESVDKKSADEETNKPETPAESKSTEPAKTTAGVGSAETSHAAGEAKPGSNGHQTEPAAGQQRGARSVGEKENNKGASCDGDGDSDPKSTGSTPEKKVA
jgi:hypothetical protein